MNTQLHMLALSIVLGIIQILVATTAATKQRGIKWNLSSRNQDMPALTGFAGRLGRAAENFKETSPFFLAAIVLAQFLQKDHFLIALGAQFYFWGRLLYVPIYAFDVTHLRTIIWSGATAGIFLILAGTLW